MLFFISIKQKETTNTLQHCRIHFRRTPFRKSPALGHLTAKSNKINKQTYHSSHPKRRRERTTGHRLLQASSRNDRSDKDQVLMYPYQGGLIPNHNKKRNCTKISFISNKLNTNDICKYIGTKTFLRVKRQYIRESRTPKGIARHLFKGSNRSALTFIL